MGSENTGGRRSVIRRLQESTHEVMRCWARRRAVSISDSRLVPSHHTPPHPPASSSVTTTAMWLLYSSNSLCYNPVLSHHEFITTSRTPDSTDPHGVGLHDGQRLSTQEDWA